MITANIIERHQLLLGKGHFQAESILDSSMVDFRYQLRGLQWHLRTGHALAESVKKQLGTCYCIASISTRARNVGRPPASSPQSANPSASSREQLLLVRRAENRPAEIAATQRIAGLQKCAGCQEPILPSHIVSA